MTDLIPRVELGGQNLKSWGFRVNESAHSELPGAALGTLDVEFQSGAVYRYYDVPQVVWGQLSSVQSRVGTAFDRLIKKGGFRYEQVLKPLRDRAETQHK